MANKVFKETSSMINNLSWLDVYKNRRKKLEGENPNQNAYINEYNKLSIFDFQISEKKSAITIL